MSGRAVRAFAVIFGLFAGLGAAPGVASASSGPTFVAAHRSGPVGISGPASYRRLTAESLGAGNWVLSATLEVEGIRPADRSVTCRLSAGGVYDVSRTIVNASSVGQQRTSLMLMVAQHFASAGTASLRCIQNGSNGDVRAWSIRMQALHVGLLERFHLGHGPGEGFDGTGGPSAVNAWSDETTTFPGGTTAQIGSVTLSQGNWWIVSKVEAQAGAGASLDCRLQAGGDYDVQYEEPPDGRVVVTNAVVHHFPYTPTLGEADLSCQADTTAHIDYVEITAVKAGSLTNQPLPGSGATPVGSGNPVVVAGYRDHASVPGGGAFSTVASMHLPQGNWAVVGKFAVSGTPTDTTADCRLDAGADNDLSTVPLGNARRQASVAVSLTHRFTATGGGNLVLRCAEPGPVSDVLDLRFIKVIAVRAGRLVDHAQ